MLKYCIFFRRLEFKMHSILFVCHGNICRSPMAEFIMKELTRAAGAEKDFYIASSAVSSEEIGNGLYPKAKAELARHGIPTEKHFAKKLTKSDYERFDVIVCMDSSNIRNALMLLGGDPEAKLHLLNEYSGKGGNVADPWYSGDFSAAYADIYAGCKALLTELL